MLLLLLLLLLFFFFFFFFLLLLLLLLLSLLLLLLFCFFLIFFIRIFILGFWCLSRVIEIYFFCFLKVVAQAVSILFQIIKIITLDIHVWDGYKSGKYHEHDSQLHFMIASKFYKFSKYLFMTLLSSDTVNDLEEVIFLVHLLSKWNCQSKCQRNLLVLFSTMLFFFFFNCLWR